MLAKGPKINQREKSINDSQIADYNLQIDAVLSKRCSRFYRELWE
jgi:hypothetical protein